MSFNAIRDNKVLTKISEFTVCCGYHTMYLFNVSILIISRHFKCTGFYVILCPSVPLRNGLEPF